MAMMGRATPVHLQQKMSYEDLEEEITNAQEWTSHKGKTDKKTTFSNSPL